MKTEAEHELREQRRENAKHTPTPWTLYIDGSISAKNYDHSKHCIAKMEFPDLIASEIDGRFIVRAVNNHDALVEVLRLVVTRYDIARDIHWRQLGLPRPHDDDNDTIRTARAALAAAQE